LESPKVLIVTVGGSIKPIIGAYREYQPDFTYFLCSKGKVPYGSEDMVDALGEPCGDPRVKKCPKCGEVVPLGEKEKSIVTQLGISGDCYKKVLISDPDNLDEVYQAVHKIAQEATSRFPNARKAINYTGGTKNMTAGAVLFALSHPEWELAIQKGPRIDLTRVTRGDTWWPVNIWGIYAEDFKIKVCRPLLSKFNYATVNQLLRPIQVNANLPYAVNSRLQRVRQLCQAFDHWDRFEHQEAISLLQSLGGLAGKWAKTAMDIVFYSLYQVVANLVLNARRREVQQRYDDAVARLYRAMEMLAQISLRETYGINTADVDLQKVPDALRDELARGSSSNSPDGRIRIGLEKDFILLDQLGDPIGKLWAEKRNKVKDVLQVRNFSILAHGDKPVTEVEYRQCEILAEFVSSAISRCKLKINWTQLPGEELVDL